MSRRPDKATVAARIAKLLRLAAGTNHPEEAQSAFARAQALLAEHHLSMGDLPGEGGPSVAHAGCGPLVATGDWQAFLATTLAKNMRCVALWRSPPGTVRGRVTFVGEAPDEAACRSAYLGGIALIEHEARAFVAQWWLPSSRAPARAVARREWIDGFLYGLKRRLDDQRASSSSVALVLVMPEAVLQAAREMSHNRAARMERAWSAGQSHAVSAGFAEGQRYTGQARLGT